MQPTDSIHSFRNFDHNTDFVNEKPMSTPGEIDLPKDVLEALQEDDLEKALALLNLHQGEGEKADGQRGILKLMSQLIKALNFPLRTAKPQKKVKAHQNSRQITFWAMKQLVRAITTVVGIPVKMTAMVLRLGKTIMGTVINTVVVKAAKPAVLPFMKTGKYLGEMYREVEKFLSEKLMQASEKIKEKTEKLMEDIRELAKPVEQWLSKKFENFVDRNRWFKTAFGQQVQNVMKSADYVINFVSFAMVPMIFTVKQMGMGLKALKVGFGKQKQKFRRFKKKVASFFAKKIQGVKKAVRPFKDAFLSVLEWIVNWLIRMLKALVRLAIRIAGALIRLCGQIINLVARLLKKCRLLN